MFTSRNCVPVLLAVAVLTVLACPATAFAQVLSTTVYDDVLNRFAPHISQWESAVKRHATWLYWTLATISLTWTGITLALKQADIQEFFSEFIKFIVSTGFFWWLLDNGPTYGKSIIDSMRLIGAEAAGVPGALNPSSLVNIGFDLFGKVASSSSLWSPVDSFVMLALSFILLVLFALIGVEIVILILSGWILGYAGVIFLGFGGGRWTQDMAISYYKALLQLGAQMMSVILLMGIGKDVLTAMAANIGSNITIQGVVVLIVAVIVFYALFTRVPYMVSGLVTGGGVQSPFTGAGGVASIGGAVMGATGAAMGAAGLASGMLGAAMSGAKEGAAGMAGAASAVMSAFGSASQDRAAGAGAFQGGEWGGGGGSVASGLGRAAQMATAVGQNLASGAAGYAKEAAGEMLQGAKADFKESVADSIGAKVADQINSASPGDAPDGAAL
jgi:type IV secretion system protein TrbL